MLAIPSLGDDAGALNPDLVIPVLVAGMVATGAAVVVTQGLDGGSNETSVENASQATDEAGEAADGDRELPDADPNGSIQDAVNATRNRTTNATNVSANATAPNATAAPGNATANVSLLDERWRTLEGTTLRVFEVTDAALGPDGERLHVVGTGVATRETEGFSNGTTVAVAAALDADDGRVRWQTRTGGPADDGASFAAVDVAPDGLVLAAGSIRRDDTSEVFLQGLNGSTGEPAWTVTFRPRYEGPAGANDVEATPDGRLVAVTGEGGDGQLTAVYDRDGPLDGFSWANVGGRTSSYRRSIGEAIAVGPHGDAVYVTGRYEDANTDDTPHLGTRTYSLPEGDAGWLSRYNGVSGGVDRGYDVAVSPDGERVAVTGESRGNGTHADYATVVYDAASGREVWSARYDGPDHGRDVPSAVAFSPDGASVFVTGEANAGADEDDAVTLAYAADDGTRLWQRSYDGGAGDGDAGVDLVPGPLGRVVYVAGYSHGEPGGTDRDVATLAYESLTGETLAQARLDASETNETSDRPAAVVASPGDQRLFVAGTSFDPEEGNRLLAAAYGQPGEDAIGNRTGDVAGAAGNATSTNATSTNATPTVSTLDERWRRIGAFDTSNGTEILDTAVGPDGERLYVAGEIRAGPETDGYPEDTTLAALAAFDTDDGRLRWTHVTGGPYGDGALLKGLDLVPTRDLVVAAGSAADGRGDDFLVLGVNATTGEQAWNATYSPEGTDVARANDVVVTPDDRWVAAAGIGGGVQPTALFDASTGDLVWSAVSGETDGAEHSIAEAIAAGPDSETIYVTGRYEDRGTSPHFGTLAYNVDDGTRRWLYAYDTGAHRGRALDVTAGPNGERVAVTGTMGPDGLTAVYNATTGDEVWSARWAGEADRRDEPWTVAFGVEGERVYVGGERHDGPVTRNGTTIAYDAAGGSILWEAHDLDWIADLQPGPEGRVLYVTGSDRGAPSPKGADVAVVPYDTRTGIPLAWGATNATGDDGTKANPGHLDVTPDGERVLVVGETVGPPHPQRALAAAFDVGFEDETG